MRKIKFLQTVPMPYYGNQGMRPLTDYIAFISNAASELKMQSTIFSIDALKFKLTHSKDRYNLHKNIKIYHFKTFMNFLKALRNAKPDIVFGNDRTAVGLITLFFGKYKIFMSHQSQNPPIWWQRQVFKFFVKRFDAIKVANSYEIEQLMELGVKKEKIHYIPIPIDHKFYAKKPSVKRLNDLRKKFGISNKDKVIMTVTHIRSQKKVHTIFKAVKKLVETNKNVKILMIGKDMLKYEGLPSAKETVKELGIEKNVIFTGYLNEEEIKDLMYLTDVGVLSSTREGQCLVAYEKAASGMPLCLSNIGSFTSVFNKSAKFHSPDDHNTLAKNINTYFKDKELSKKHGKLNMGLVRKLCDYDTNMKQFKLVLQKYTPK